MRNLWSVMTTVVLAAVTAAVVAEEHHVVGGDRGWEVTNDIASWYSHRIFSVGDIIWFTYSAAHESIVELGSKEEYLSCDLTNPIRMYTEGLDKIPLDGEGIRYFASGNLDSCKNGLKLPVTVQSQHKNYNTIQANPPHLPPPQPSASTTHFPIMSFALLPLLPMLL